MCTCSREVTETGRTLGGEDIKRVTLTDSDMNAACQRLCCQTPDCAGGDVLSGGCDLYKDTESSNVVIEPSKSGNFAFLC